MELKLRCRVFPGQFSDEYAVSAEQADGTRFSLFAPAQAVETEEDPTRDHVVVGWLKVSRFKQGESQMLVRLPSESFESGRFVTVRADQFKVWPAPEEAAMQ